MQDEYRLWQRNGGIFYVCHGSGRNTRRISTRTAVRSQAEQFRAQFIAGLENPAPSPSATIDDLLDLYYQQHGPRTKSPDTIKYHLKHLKKYFGQLRPEHVSNRSLQDYAIHRKKEGTKRGSQIVDVPISDGTILREVGTLKSALKFAAGMRWIYQIPEFKAPVDKPSPRDIWLSRKEAIELIEATPSPHVKLFIQIALGTAARSGAILELSWDNVDFEHRLVDFGRGNGNKRRSIVPMNDYLFKALKEAYETSVSGWVIEYGGSRIKSVKGAFRRLTIGCGIDATPHVLRHTAATWMVLAGIPLAEVARLLGDSEKTVENVYGKHSPDYLKRAVNALEPCGKVQEDSYEHQ